eukprot:m.88069 g.88069  ORF g.88069 m.88069 type:complete len:57 (-) comp16428_c0_seq1:10-180(-)
MVTHICEYVMQLHFGEFSTRINEDTGTLHLARAQVQICPATRTLPSLVPALRTPFA